MKIKINWSGKAHNYNKKEKKYLLNVLDSDTFTQGKEKENFERELRKYLKRENVFCTSSAASSLELIAALLEIKKGD